ncbi:MAG: endonuclease [Rhizobacter sp.]|nr:endonuclease [Bacteriovorax sp.]
MEGPSLTILKEELRPFRGEKVLRVSGNTKQDKDELKGATLAKIETWGKVLFLNFKKINHDPILTKTHFMMFGIYRINDPKPDRDPRLTLKFQDGRIDFYACSIKFDAEEYFETRDWQVDLMSKKWDKKHVLELVEEVNPETFLCDLLLDQNIFTGSGNIVKNEVLFNLRRHPLTRLSSIKKKDWPKLVDAVHEYMWNFYKWKKEYQLRRHWQVYKQHKCPLCNEKLVSAKIGKFERRTYYCENDQPLKKINSKLDVFDVLPMKPAKKPEKRLDH